MSAATGPSPTAGIRDGSAILVRWILGIVFIYMGMNKALHPAEFLKLVRQYELLGPYFLLNSVAAALPWFEVFCGLLLLAGVAVRGTALVLVGMLIPFTLVVLKRALAIAATQDLPFCAVKFDCGCGTGEVLICRKLVENSLQIIGCCWLMAPYGRRLALCFDPVARNATPRSETHEIETKA